uniref:Uncharacterized protein n=1 Tax=Triticum urartu TaxID=4572 RepID=A0A8R7V2Z9_TRIUA
MQYGGLDRLRWKNGQPAGQHGYLTSISLGFRWLKRICWHPVHAYNSIPCSPRSIICPGASNGFKHASGCLAVGERTM